MPRLLLINPSNENKGLGNIRSTSWPPLNLPYIASLTPGTYNIEVIDENVEEFRYRPADLVGITAYTSSVTRGYEISEMYRAKGIPTVMGGIHVSMMPEEALNYCDSIVIGEAESVWPELLQDFELKQLKKRYEGEMLEIDSLPSPRREVLDTKHYLWGSIQTSRGCPLNCSFCSVTAFNGKHFRRRNLDNVINELKDIPQKFVLLADDNFIGHDNNSRQWAKDFFNRVLQEGINKYFFAQSSMQFGEDEELIRIASKAGLKVLFIGIESIKADNLKSFNKQLNLKRLNDNQYQEHITKIRKGGIAVLGSFLLGSDEDTPPDFLSTLEFIRSAGIDIVQLTKPTPLPGTEFWDQLIQEDRIIKADFPRDWEEYRLSKLVFQPKKMSIEDVYKGFTFIRSNYYSWPVTLKRTINTLLTTKSIISTVMAYKFNASYRKAFLVSEHYHLYHRPEAHDLFRKV